MHFTKLVGQGTSWMPRPVNYKDTSLYMFNIMIMQSRMSFTCISKIEKSGRFYILNID